MTSDNKAKLLAAFDALCTIQSGKPAQASPHPHSHGGSAQCDLCGHSLADPTPHACPVGRALSALQELVPEFYARDAWLADGSAPDWRPA